jgi:hypothetical protein
LRYETATHSVAAGGGASAASVAAQGWSPAQRTMLKLFADTLPAEVATAW